jgi:hypothetical protein
MAADFSEHQIDLYRSAFSQIIHTPKRRSATRKDYCERF